VGRIDRQNSPVIEKKTPNGIPTSPRSELKRIALGLVGFRKKLAPRWSIGGNDIPTLARIAAWFEFPVSDDYKRKPEPFAHKSVWPRKSERQTKDKHDPAHAENTANLRLFECAARLAVFAYKFLRVFHRYFRSLSERQQH
jgi:hypothetical protein